MCLTGAAAKVREGRARKTVWSKGGFQQFFEDAAGTRSFSETSLYQSRVVLHMHDLGNAATINYPVVSIEMNPQFTGGPLSKLYASGVKYKAMRFDMKEDGSWQLHTFASSYAVEPSAVFSAFANSDVGVLQAYREVSVRELMRAPRTVEHLKLLLHDIHTYLYLCPGFQEHDTDSKVHGRARDLELEFPTDEVQWSTKTMPSLLKCKEKTMCVHKCCRLLMVLDRGVKRGNASTRCEKCRGMRKAINLRFTRWEKRKAEGAAAAVLQPGAGVKRDQVPKSMQSAFDEKQRKLVEKLRKQSKRWKMRAEASGEKLRLSEREDRDYTRILEGMQRGDLDMIDAESDESKDTAWLLMMNWQAEQRAREASGGPAASSGRRWPEWLLRMLLHVYNKSHAAYEKLKELDLFILPSGRTLRRFQARTRTKQGFAWYDASQGYRAFEYAVRERAADLSVYKLMLAHDEMSEKVSVGYVEGKQELVGMAYMGDNLDDILFGKSKQRDASKFVAKRVTIFLLRGLTHGFSFPIAHYHTNSAVSSTLLYTQTLKIVGTLTTFGLRIAGVAADAAQNNRVAFSLMKTHPICPAAAWFCIMDTIHMLKRAWKGLVRSPLKEGWVLRYEPGATDDNKEVKVSIWHVKQVYDESVKGERWRMTLLSKECVAPGPFTGLKVGPATIVTSPEVQAAVEEKFGGEAVLFTQGTSEYIEAVRGLLVDTLGSNKQVFARDLAQLKEKSNKLLKFWHDWFKFVKDNNLPSHCFCTMDFYNDLQELVKGVCGLAEYALDGAAEEVFTIVGKFASQANEEMHSENRSGAGHSNDPTALQTDAFIAAKRADGGVRRKSKRAHAGFKRKLKKRKSLQAESRKDAAAGAVAGRTRRSTRSSAVARGGGSLSAQFAAAAAANDAGGGGSVSSVVGSKHARPGVSIDDFSYPLVPAAEGLTHRGYVKVRKTSDNDGNLNNLNNLNNNNNNNNDDDDDDDDDDGDPFLYPFLENAAAAAVDVSADVVRQAEAAFNILWSGSALVLDPYATNIIKLLVYSDATEQNLMELLQENARRLHGFLDAAGAEWNAMSRTDKKNSSISKLFCDKLSGNFTPESIQADVEALHRLIIEAQVEDDDGIAWRLDNMLPLRNEMPPQFRTDDFDWKVQSVGVVRWLMFEASFDAFELALELALDDSAVRKASTLNALTANSRGLVMWINGWAARALLAHLLLLSKPTKQQLWEIGVLKKCRTDVASVIGWSTAALTLRRKRGDIYVPKPTFVYFTERVDAQTHEGLNALSREGFVQNKSATAEKCKKKLLGSDVLKKDWVKMLGFCGVDCSGVDVKWVDALRNKYVLKYFKPCVRNFLSYTMADVWSSLGAGQTTTELLRNTGVQARASHLKRKDAKAWLDAGWAAATQALGGDSVLNKCLLLRVSICEHGSSFLLSFTVDQLLLQIVPVAWQACAEASGHSMFEFALGLLPPVAAGQRLRLKAAGLKQLPKWQLISVVNMLLGLTKYVDIVDPREYTDAVEQASYVPLGERNSRSLSDTAQPQVPATEAPTSEERCRCDVPAVWRCCRNSRNHGRWFMTCVKGNCAFFHWHSPSAMAVESAAGEFGAAELAACRAVIGGVLVSVADTMAVDA